jgi:hypothetical protein
MGPVGAGQENAGLLAPADAAGITGTGDLKQPVLSGCGGGAFHKRFEERRLPGGRGEWILNQRHALCPSERDSIVAAQSLLLHAVNAIRAGAA